ncbi:hypothetical protein HXX76_007069 [Chlamydomonas incerta]|uniref:Uncharacterized protein n=1 Tax=Chlamydomonas incerta TaxID=51695 RepID=A0A835T8R5_CHLIN|nr:hypothetical protein HXX76_007069 [Chlamydomonas incerta]|eukprot:KAG2435874.1 hypothetical protein HXX76_007069 [Chlamydomonas incerta]
MCAIYLPAAEAPSCNAVDAGTLEFADAGQAVSPANLEDRFEGTLAAKRQSPQSPPTLPGETAVVPELNTSSGNAPPSIPTVSTASLDAWCRSALFGTCSDVVSLAGGVGMAAFSDDNDGGQEAGSQHATATSFDMEIDSWLNDSPASPEEPQPTSAVADCIGYRRDLLTQLTSQRARTSTDALL